jgi:putative membrane protein
MDTICETIERNLESMQREAQCGELGADAFRPAHNAGA